MSHGASSNMSRRNAIRSLAALAALPAFPALSRLQPYGQGWLDRIGLALITVRGLAARDFEGTLQAVAKIGYRDLDMYIYEGRRSAKETRAILDRAGLTCRSARVATPALYRGWDRSLDAAKELGARWITLANVPWEERLTMRDWQELSELFNRVGEAARRRELGFCYHNHDFELQPLEGKVPLDVMLAATDAGLVKLQMDVYWVTKGGRDPASEITRLGSRVASLHLKDMDRTPERGITSVGAGMIDFTRILGAAKLAGVADYFVEEDAPKDPLAAARAGYTHLSALAP
jgi:sugar phosphate isomerase/epimerase